MEPATIKQKYDDFVRACLAAGRDVRQFEVCKMTFMAIAPDAAAAGHMREELAARSNVTPEALAARTLVATPDVIAARLRELTEIGVNHHILNVAESEQWPRYTDALELAAREVVARVRGA
jgi:alkanesulfonate monooxygenase SsuD/methylene tetrahydromethanopterin reductase-like flavin-dependent oxidoreductase (luciferase family)